MMNEIALRKQTTEKECIARYTVAADKTKNTQQELDELLKANEFKRQELSLALKRKQEAISAEIDKLKKGYAGVLDEKKAAYEKYLAEVNEKCTNLRNEINDLENKKAIEQSKLETYENEKQTSINDLTRSVKDYIDNVSEQISQLQDKQHELEDVHNKRIYNIKTEIASTMSEYDTLLRSRPELLDDTREKGENDLAKRTKLFIVHNVIYIRILKAFRTFCNTRAYKYGNGIRMLFFHYLCRIVHRCFCIRYKRFNLW